MLNPDIATTASAENMSQVSSYFQSVDNAVRMGDTNKKYRPSTNGCYSPSCPVQSNSYTTVIISPSCDNTADLYNSYIYAEMKFNVDLKGVKADQPFMTGSGWNDTKWGTNSPERVWVGFKDSLDAIEKYEILANGVLKCNQNFVIEESYITNCASLETIKNANIYSKSRHKDVWENRYREKCGAIIDFKGAKPTYAVEEGAETASIKPGVFDPKPREVTIRLKIDLRRFLPLSNLN
jgi:hypothetical protein